MDITKELIKKFGNSTQQGKKKNADSCAAAIISVWLNGVGLETVDTGLRELLFLETKNVAKKADVTSIFVKYMLDSLHRTLFNVGIYRSVKKPPLMNSKVSRATNLISGVYEKEIERLKTQKEGLSPTDHLDSALFFAAFESGLCFEEGLEAFQTAVLTYQKPPTSISDDIFFNLCYERHNHKHNRRTAGFSYTERKFFPGGLTLLAVTGFLKSRPLLCVEQTAKQRLRKKIEAHVSHGTLNNVSTALLLQAVAMSISQRVGAQMPSFLMHYASGKVCSTSTFDESLLAMHAQDANHNSCTKLEQRALLPSVQKSSVKKRKLNSYNFEINRQLREIFKQEHSTPNIDEACRKEVISALQALRRHEVNTLSEPECLLLDWLLYQFTHGTLRRFGSGARYLSAMGTIWLHLTERIAVSGLEPDEIDELYFDLQRMGQNSDSSFSDMLENLMEYLHKVHDIELPTPLQKTDGKKSEFVRSTLPSSAHLEQLLVDVDKIYSNTTEHLRDSVLAMLIIMMRMGLRPHEIANLEIKDVTLNGTGHIFVRRNPHYKPKTASSARQIQIDPLLRRKEREFIRRFIRRRQDEVTDGKFRQVKSALLFTMQPSRNVQFDMREISTHVTALLSQYSGVRTPLYQLRHYALTMFQLICFASTERVRHFSSYSVDEIERIRRYFQPSDSFNILYKIASVAGHLTPDTSLSTYCHCTDLLLHEAVLRTEASIDFSVIQKLSRIQSAKLKSLADQTQVQTQRMNNPELLQLAKLALQQERTRWTNNLKPKRSQGVSK